MRIGVLISVALHVCLLAGCDSREQPSKAGAQAAATKPSTAPTTQPSENAWPLTVAQAVDRLVATLPEKDQATIRAMRKEDMIGLHMQRGLRQAEATRL